MIADDPACRDVVEVLTEYLEGALDPADAARLEVHLAECDGCASVLAQLRTTVALAGRLRAADVDAVDPRVRADLLEAFRRWSGTGRDDGP